MRRERSSGETLELKCDYNFAEYKFEHINPQLMLTSPKPLYLFNEDGFRHPFFWDSTLLGLLTLDNEMALPSLSPPHSLPLPDDSTKTGVHKWADDVPGVPSHAPSLSKGVVLYQVQRLREF